MWQNIAIDCNINRKYDWILFNLDLNGYHKLIMELVNLEVEVGNEQFLVNDDCSNPII